MKKKLKNIVEHRYYDLPSDFPAVLLSGDKWYISDIVSNRFHFHNCTEIGFCRSGSGTLLFDGDQKVPFKTGDISIIGQHNLHTTYSDPGTTSLWSYIFLDFSALLSDNLFMNAIENNIAQDYHLPSDMLFNEKEHRHIHFLAKSMFEELEHDATDMPIIFKATTLALYHHLERFYNEQTPLEQLDQIKLTYFVLKPAIDFIQSNYMDKIVIKDLADLCHLSENHFRRQFLSVMGTSPLAFLNFTRINKACVLLGSSNRPILTVAEAVGFYSMASFNRNFKDLLEVTPREYRKKVRRKTTLNIQQRIIQSYPGWTEA